MKVTLLEILNFVGYTINQNEPLAFLQRNDLIKEIQEQGYILNKHIGRA